MESDGMIGDSSTIEIKKKRYEKTHLSMLLGLEHPSDLASFIKSNTIPEDILNIAWVLDKPTRLPVALKSIYEISRDDNDTVRLALARAQIDAALHLNENLRKYTKQKFVAETMERMIFGELLLEGKSKKNSRKKNGNDKEGNSQKKRIPKKKSTTAGSAKKTVKKKKAKSSQDKIVLF